MTPDLDRQLHALASRQHGVFSREQALTLGFTATQIVTRLGTGIWIRLRRGVYAVPGTAATWERRAAATLLAAGGDAVLSHFAAGSCLEILDGRPERIDVAVGGGRRKSGAHVHRIKDFHRGDTRTAGGFRVTCPERTLVDLAGVAPKHVLEGALDRAVIKGFTTLERIRGYIRTRGLARRKGVGVLMDLIEDREMYGVTETELERRFLEAIRKRKLPEPVRQRPVVKRRVDFLYPIERIFIEVDGRNDHARKPVFEDDRRRQNELVLAGLLPLRFTWDDVTKRVDYVGETVGRALLDRAGGGS